MRVHIGSMPALDAPGGRAAALGTFDGLHAGHVALISELKRIADGRRLKTLAYTFTSVPAELFLRPKAGIRLFTLEEKIAAFERTGVDELVLVDFDKAYASIPEEAFVKNIVQAFDIRCVVVGYNFSYGRLARGNSASLVREGQKYGFGVDVIAPVLYGGVPVSSSRIREALRQGDVEAASGMLGYAYAISGVVAQGRRIGRHIGYPTVNLRFDKNKVLPRNGVYATRVALGGQTHKGVTNIGLNPTVSDGGLVSIETHIVGFDRDVYGETIRVEFIRRLRDEIRFPDKDKLREQIGKDVQSALTTVEI